MGILSWITFIPAFGAVLILALPRNSKRLIQGASLIFTFIPLLLSIYLMWNFKYVTGADSYVNNFQFIEKVSWIPAFHVEYFVGVDGLSIAMVILTTLLSFLCIPASFGIDKGVKGYFALFLILETGMLGTFVALDLFLFYVFWEVMLLPMYFLIGIWGGPRREYAAIKFFLYTLLGSVFMLLGILALYFYSGTPTFDMLELTRRASSIADPSLTILGLPLAKLVFVAFFFGFAIKVPMVPFHTWLPDAHVEAPTPISVILAGILLKMGTYGVFRVCYPILPKAAVWFAPLLAVFGVINILYGAFCAMSQKDFKKLVAYSSVSHMGYCLLGLAAMTQMGLAGSLFQMFNHGTVTAMLFLLVGVVYDRAHHREIEGFGGLASRMPIYAGISALAFFAALGLPGLSSFVSEALVLLGSFQADTVSFSGAVRDILMFASDNLFRIATIFAALGVVVTAAYMLWTYQRIFLGPLNEKYKDMPEINAREVFTLVPLMVIVVFLGIYPRPFLTMAGDSIRLLSSILMGQ